MFRRILLALAFAAMCPGVRADTGGKDQAPPPPQLELGFEERFRSENWDDLADWDAERNDTLRQVRFRTRLWASVPLGSQATFYVSLNVEWDEQALGGYFTSRPLAGATVEAYYFYKIEGQDPRPPDNPQYQTERRLSTLGARVTKPLGRGWTLAGEYARQWGRQHPDTDIAAWGGYAYARKTFAAAWEPTATAGFWALSGDDPATPANENWDPLFSRWPK
jgi:hypothetical protein